MSDTRSEWRCPARGGDAQLEDAVEHNCGYWTERARRFAGLVVLGTFMMLRYRKVRDCLTLQPTASESMLPSSFNLSALLVATGIMRSDSVCSGPDTGYRPSVVELSDAPGHPRKRGGNGGDVEWKDDLV